MAPAADAASAQPQRAALPEGSSRIYRYVLVSTGLAFFNRAMPTPFLPLVLVQEIGLPMAEVGLVLAAYPLGALAATSWCCRTARGTHAIVRLHSLAILAMAGVALLFPVVWALLASGALGSGAASRATAVAGLRALQGACQAMYLASNTSLITRRFAAAVPYVVGMAEVAVGLGSQCARLVAGPLYDLGGLACPFCLTAGLQAACACAGFAFEEAAACEPGSCVERAAEPMRHDLPWSSLLTPRVAIALAAVSFSYSMTGLYDATLPQHLEDYLGPLSVTVVGWVSSLRPLTYLFVSYWSAQLLHRGLVSLEFLVTAGFGCVVLGLLTAAPQTFFLELAPSVFDTPSGRWCVMVLSIVLGAGGNAMTFVPSLPLMQREVRHLGRRAEEQVAMLFMSGMSVGEATGPILGGSLVEACGFTATTGLFALPISAMVAASYVAFYTAAVQDRGEPLAAAALCSPILQSGPAAPGGGLARQFSVDGESAYSYRLIPFVLGGGGQAAPGSAPPTSFRREYVGPAAPHPKSATEPSSSWRRPYRPSAARPGGSRQPSAPELAPGRQLGR